MKNETPPKQLRSFGLIVGGIFAFIAVWPVIIRGGDVRGWAAVAATLSCFARRGRAEEFVLAAQRLDGVGSCLRLDQYADHPGADFFCDRDPYWTDQTMAGKRSYGPAVAT